MTDKEKSVVAIAKDVLKTINKRNIKSESYYCQVPYEQQANKLFSSNGNAQKHIPTIEKFCQVCAIGTCFLSFIKLYNNIKLKDINNDRSMMVDYLSQFFDERQLDLIEIAFERSLNYTKTNIQYNELELYYRAKLFGQKYIKDHNRIKAIMLNIIKNKGWFRP